MPRHDSTGHWSLLRVIPDSLVGNVVVGNVVVGNVVVGNVVVGNVVVGNVVVGNEVAPFDAHIFLMYLESKECIFFAWFGFR